MKEEFEILCGKWTDRVTVDRNIFEKHEEACFEAATRSFEKYFQEGHTEERNLTTCVVRPLKVPNNKKDYLIFPPRLYENIGLHIVTNYFKINKI
tara:strand:- start:99 stop:383 length:285 start_codon:yes stop_codon:yes gene_type:complete